MRERSQMLNSYTLYNRNPSKSESRVQCTGTGTLSSSSDKIRTESRTDGGHVASVNQLDNTDGVFGEHIFLSVGLQDRF